MFSYLHPSDYILWFIFIVAELLLFLKIKQDWLAPLKYFLLYACVRDIVLLCLTPFSMTYYFYVYWTGNMISGLWYSYIVYKSVRYFAPKTPTPLQLSPIFIVSCLCMLYAKYILGRTEDANLQLLSFQKEYLGVCTLILLSTAAVARLHRLLIVTILPLAGLLAIWLWVYLGQKAWELIWIFALITVGLILKPLQQQPLVCMIQPTRPVVL